MQNHLSSNKGPFYAVVSDNKQIGHCFYKLGLEFTGSAAEALADSQPGQFIEIDLSASSLPPVQAMSEGLADAAQRNILLRRPFSFCGITTQADKTIAETLYCVVGPASLRMTSLSKGDSVSIIGPLGSGFSVPEGKETALLVSGGMGAGPLEHLARVLTESYPKMNVIAFAGAKTRETLPFIKPLDEISKEIGFSLAEFAEYGIQSSVATDDGSVGFAGPVTDCLVEWLGGTKLAPESTIIYTCGPEAMLAKIAEIAAEQKLDCQVSMERRMACGIGVCQSCAVECKINNTNKTVYKMCCTDGPVFNSKEVIFEQ